MDGILLLHKPAGITSFDAVSRCRKIFHEKKIGHSGTLDPNASGLMIVLIGRYTKYLPYCIKDHKHYHATFQFGQRTDTGDIWGTVLEEKDPHVHSLQDIQQAANAFLGDGFQIPPMVSAIKQNGKKLYELARRGIEVERKPRPVHISHCQIEEIDGTWHMDTVVSGGTYIRTLITDLGDSLGEFAVMSSLERRGIEHVRLEEAILPDTLSEMDEEGRKSVFVNPRRIIDPSFPIVPAEDVDAVIHGRRVSMNCNHATVIFEHDNEILAVYEKRSDGLYHCQRGLL